MEKDTNKTRVAFFRDKKGRNVPRGCGQIAGYHAPVVTAVFVDTLRHDEEQDKWYDCYAHIGQHDNCMLKWVQENCKAATYKEYKSLLDEMEANYGYNIEVVEAAWWLDCATGSVEGAA